MSQLSKDNASSPNVSNSISKPPTDSENNVERAIKCAKWRSNMFAAIAAILLFVAFMPALYWLYEGIAQSSQLRDAIVILVSACVVMALNNSVKLSKPHFGRLQVWWLFIAYALIGVSYLAGMWRAVFILGGLAAAGVAVGLSVLSARRYVYAAAAAFFAFTILAYFINFIDMPLRFFAGSLASDILSRFYDNVMLLGFSGQSPQIALQVNGQSFLVATECNGFGIIASCVLIGIFGAILKGGGRWYFRLLLPVISGAIAYIANAARIITIVVCAPIVGQSHYFLMHEIFGYIYFALALVAVWSLCLKNKRN